MSRPFVIRDRDGRVGDALGSAPLLNAIARPGLEHIDIWPQGRRQCTVGFDWADGSTAIGDLPWTHEAAIGWLQQRGLGRLIRHHIASKRS